MGEVNKNTRLGSLDLKRNCGKRSRILYFCFWTENFLNFSPLILPTRLWESINGHFTEDTITGPYIHVLTNLLYNPHPRIRAKN